MGLWDEHPVPVEEWVGRRITGMCARHMNRDIKHALDGEPSCEEILHGLHDPTMPYWTAREMRRYAWRSVLSGAAGFTYGHNSVMQGRNRIGAAAYGARRPWKEAMDSAAARYIM